MADNAPNAVLVLTAGEPIEVQQTLEQIQSLVADSPRGDMSFLQVVDVQGKSHWVNVRMIVECREPPDRGSGAVA